MKTEEKKEVSTIEKKEIFNPEKDLLFIYSQELGAMRKVDAKDLIGACSEQVVSLAFKGINIGIRNLILNSKLNLKDVKDYKIVELKTSVDLVEGQKYTMVIRGYVNSPQRFMVLMNGDGGTGVGYISEFGNDIETRVITFTAISPNSETSKRMLRIYNVPRASHSTNPASIEWVALYQGEIKPPLDWSPAPEDIEARLSALENK